MPASPNDDPKARRAVRALRVCMAVGIVLPFLLFWLFR